MVLQPQQQYIFHSTAAVCTKQRRANELTHVDEILRSTGEPQSTQADDGDWYRHPCNGLHLGISLFYCSLCVLPGSDFREAPLAYSLTACSQTRSVRLPILCCCCLLLLLLWCVRQGTLAMFSLLVFSPQSKQQNNSTRILYVRYSRLMRCLLLPVSLVVPFAPVRNSTGCRESRENVRTSPGQDRDHQIIRSSGSCGWRPRLDTLTDGRVCLNVVRLWQKTP